LGASTALLGQTFVSDGAGSGAWKHGTDIHGEMVVTGFTTSLAVPLAVDPTLATDTDYIKITAASMWSAGHLDGITFNIDELVAPVDGTYELNFWASIEVAVTSTLIGVKYAIDDATPYSTRKILNKAKTASDVNNIFGVGFVGLLTAGQTVSMYIAADTASGVIVREAGLTMKLLEEA